jgi:hypothetical protein
MSQNEMKTAAQWDADAAELERQAAEFRREAATQRHRDQELARLKAAEIPVDRSAVQLTTGAPVPADGSHTERDATGMQKGYVVLSEEERAKGFVRPYRDSYWHVGVRPDPAHVLRDLTPEEAGRYAGQGYVKFEEYPKDGRSGLGRYWTQAQLESGCGCVTTMGRALSETYARDPSFYGGTFCSTCGEHFKVGERGEFVWTLDGQKVGT